MTASRSHWSVYDPRWRRMTPPLRVHPAVVDAYHSVVGSPAGRTLLLGSTRELADIVPDLVAVDGSAARVANVWPGNTPRRRAVVGDWRELPFRERGFSAALGDGGLNILEFPHNQVRILAELSRVLRAAAPVALRVFSRPERGESLASLRTAALAGRAGNFQAFKLRLAMAIVAAASTPNVAVRTIWEVFQQEFPDRRALAEAAGWHADDIATIDLYETSSEIYCFPTRAQLADAVPAALGQCRFVETKGYDLAERCPLLVAERR